MSGTTQAGEDEALTALHQADATYTFGPSFFLSYLRRFVRDQCPDPKEQLPTVHVGLADGEALDVCHIIGVAPRWVVLAVRDPLSHGRMAIELVPYDLIRRVGISMPQGRHSASPGFSHAAAPAVLTPELLLQSVMTPETSATPPQVDANHPSGGRP